MSSSFNLVSSFSKLQITDTQTREKENQQLYLSTLSQKDINDFVHKVASLGFEIGKSIPDDTVLLMKGMDKKKNIEVYTITITTVTRDQLTEHQKLITLFQKCLNKHTINPDPESLLPVQPQIKRLIEAFNRSSTILGPEISKIHSWKPEICQAHMVDMCKNFEFLPPELTQFNGQLSKFLVSLTDSLEYIYSVDCLDTTRLKMLYARKDQFIDFFSRITQNLCTYESSTLPDYLYLNRIIEQLVQNEKTEDVQFFIDCGFPVYLTPDSPFWELSSNVLKKVQMIVFDERSYGQFLPQIKKYTSLKIFDKSKVKDQSFEKTQEILNNCSSLRHIAFFFTNQSSIDKLDKFIPELKNLKSCRISIKNNLHRTLSSDCFITFIKNNQNTLENILWEGVSVPQKNHTNLQLSCIKKLYLSDNRTESCIGAILTQINPKTIKALTIIDKVYGGEGLSRTYPSLQFLQLEGRCILTNLSQFSAENLQTLKITLLDNDKSDEVTQIMVPSTSLKKLKHLYLTGDSFKGTLFSDKEFEVLKTLRINGTAFDPVCFKGFKAPLLKNISLCGELKALMRNEKGIEQQVSETTQTTQPIQFIRIVDPNGDLDSPRKQCTIQ